MLKVISNELMRISDSNEINKNHNATSLMASAAKGVFDHVTWHGKIGIVCGSGNNAGDGYALALLLKEASFDVDVILCSEKVSETSSYFYNQLENVNKVPFNKELTGYDIIVDCLLGTGFSGVPRGLIKDAIEWINQEASYIVSVDINSGISGETGLGEVFVESDLTISIGTYKYGHFINQGMDAYKKIINVDIGIPTEEDGYLLEESDFKSFFVKRKHYSNKGTYGYVGIMGGSKNYPGAPQLASLGQNALYAGAGVSRLIVPECISQILYQKTLETTVYPMTDYSEEELDRAIKGLKVLAVGPGMGLASDNLRIIKYILCNYEGILIIDADGLNILSQLDLNILNESKAKIVLTPHLKEFSRLTGYSVSDIEKYFVLYAKEFTQKYNVTLLLKGPTTIIVDKNQFYLENRGTPGMAKAGSGDVLTGILTGILGYYQENITYTVSIGAMLNGLAGEVAEKEYGEISMVSSDTARCVSKVLKNI